MNAFKQDISLCLIFCFSTDISVLLNLKKNLCINYHECGLEDGHRRYPIHGLIGQIYHNTFEICLKGVDKGGDEVLKKKKCIGLNRI